MEKTMWEAMGGAMGETMGAQGITKATPKTLMGAMQLFHHTAALGAQTMAPTVAAMEG